MRIININDLPDKLYHLVGGKAKGLAKLAKIGINVPKGFVIIDIEIDDDLTDIITYFKDNNYEKVAVRSSANNEDGSVFSSAGQYTSVLNVTLESLEDAIKVCLGSLNSETATAYANTFNDAKSTKMNIVVQQMIDAKYAGVTFTTNPITRSKKLLIEAVEGLGEDLVSGLKSASSYDVTYDYVVTGEGVLDTNLVKEVAIMSMKAKESFDEELDLEWAIDQNNNLFFLQARPITTLEDATIDELDCKVFHNEETDVFTTCNIGEMLPGAVTPLSLSTSVNSIDIGLIRMLKRAGAFKKNEDVKAGSCVTSFSNHLFFNLTTIFKMASTIIGANQQAVEVSICGKKLDTPPTHWQVESTLKRLNNAMKYFKFLLSRKKAIKKIDKLIDSLSITLSGNPKEYYQNISDNLYKLDDATWYHYITSAHSGAMSSGLVMVLDEFYDAPEETRAVIAELLENIDDIESVDILRSMRRIARNLLNTYPESINYSTEELYVLIQSDSGIVKEAYDSFINRHGHRSIREAELRNKSWQNDIPGLMENILLVMKSGANEETKPNFDLDEKLKELTKDKKYAMRKAITFLTKQSRQGVYNREYTKSRFVRAVDAFKEAYAKLAEILVGVDILPDADLIYFLTHDELGDLINNNNNKLIKKAIQRRSLLDEQKEVRFNDVYIGKPTPLVLEDIALEKGTILNGVPISRGEVSGVARVVKSVEDAKDLKDGEIMVAAFTDIGWSPYYSVIKGLITEVGSALSHGAVVAREYALPLVVNVSNATRLIKTGDVIRLNATKGTITIVE